MKIIINRRPARGESGDWVRENNREDSGSIRAIAFNNISGNTSIERGVRARGIIWVKPEIDYPGKDCQKTEKE